MKFVFFNDEYNGVYRLYTVLQKNLLFKQYM